MYVYLTLVTNLLNNLHFDVMLRRISHLVNEKLAQSESLISTKYAYQNQS